MRELCAALGRTPHTIACGPARANLIGEHVDNFGGTTRATQSIPFAIDRRIVAAAASRDDDRVELRSLDQPQPASFSLAELDDAAIAAIPTWDRYPRAVAKVLLDRGHRLLGLDGVLKSEIPGNGLSSSAALTGALVRMFSELSHLDLDGEEIVSVSHDAEHKTGSLCGYMDQMASVFGESGRGLVVSFKQGAMPTHEAVNLDLGAHALVVVDSGRDRQLKTSKYRDRLVECGEALAIFQRLLRSEGREIGGLGDLEIEDLLRHEGEVPPIALQRARHVVTEMERVARTKRILSDVVSTGPEKARRLGAELTACHRSLADDFGVSCPELDALVDLALEHGALGARLMGAGEGGNMIFLARRGNAEVIAKKMLEGYCARVEAGELHPSRAPSWFIAQPSAGNRSLELPRGA